MAVNYAGKLNALTLEARSFAEQVVILGNLDSPEGRGSPEKQIVAERIRSILLCRDDIDTTQPECRGDRPWHVYVHVEFDVQRARFKSLNLCWKAGSDTSIAKAIDSCCVRAICVSSAD